MRDIVMIHTHTKIKIKGQSVQKTEWKQTDRKTLYYVSFCNNGQYVIFFNVLFIIDVSYHAQHPFSFVFFFRETTCTISINSKVYLAYTFYYAMHNGHK